MSFYKAEKSCFYFREFFKLCSPAGRSCFNWLNVNSNSHAQLTHPAADARLLNWILQKWR